MFRTVTLRATTASTVDFAECEDCGVLLRPEESVLILHEATHAQPVAGDTANASAGNVVEENPHRSGTGHIAEALGIS